MRDSTIYRIFSLRNRTKVLRNKRIYDIIKYKGDDNLAFCYNKLWKLLIDKGINKTDLREMTGISQSTIAKLSKGKNVNTDVLERICISLNCELEDICELTENNKGEVSTNV